MLRVFAVLPLLLAACSSGAPKSPAVVAAALVPAAMPADTVSAPGQISAPQNIYLSGTLLKSDEVFRRLLAELRSADAAKRTCAATELGLLRRNRRDLVPPLAYALKNDRSKWVRRAAAKSLGRIGSREVIAPLRLALTDRDRWVAHSAANALARLGA